MLSNFVKSAIFVLGLSVLFGANSRADALADCFKGNQVADLVLACVQKRYDYSDTDMLRSYKFALSKAGKTLDFIKAKAGVEKSQSLWLDYKAAHCDLFASSFTDKDEAELQALKCQIKLNGERASALRTLYPLKDTCGCSGNKLEKINSKKKPIIPTE